MQQFVLSLIGFQRLPWTLIIAWLARMVMMAYMYLLFNLLWLRETNLTIVSVIIFSFKD